MKFKLLSLLTLFSLAIMTPKAIYKKDIKKAQQAANVRYNLCVFIRFHDEEEYINDVIINDLTKKDIVDNTYNAEEYSLRDYYKGLTSNKVDLKTVYLFPDETGFSSFYLDGNRENYAKKSSTNPNGYTIDDSSAGQLFINDWSNKINEAFNKGILPCSISSREDTISYQALDSDQNKKIDSLTLILSPQVQTNFSTSRQEPLYPCKDVTSKVSINIPGTQLESYDYNQWVPNYESMLHTQGSDKYFLPFSTGAHEMGHVFGFNDLYDYYQKEFPVGNMSIMSNAIPPVPQYMTSYERELKGWINKENVQSITSSGTYTLTPVMDNNQTGIAAYKVPILNCENKWLYFEYRNFLNKDINKYDAKDKDLYYSNGNKVEVTSGKSGIVVYIVNNDGGYPTNSHGRKAYFGLEVLGGSNNNRSDAPRVEGDYFSVTSYNSEGTLTSTGIKVTIGSINETNATFTINYNELDSLKKISADDLNNTKLYDKLTSIKAAPLLNTSFDDQTLLDLSKLDIENLDVLNLFDFKNLKYLVLFGNRIASVDGLSNFISNHPNTIIVLDNNNINLSSLPSEILDNKNVFYGLQNTQSNRKTLEYHINESFSPGSYQICYQFEDEGIKYLQNKGYNSFELKDNVLVNITSYYFFTDRLSMNFKYTLKYVPDGSGEVITPVDPDEPNVPISLSLIGDEEVNVEYGDEYVDLGVNTNYPNNLNISITCSKGLVQVIDEIDDYVIKYTVSVNGEEKTISRIVKVRDTMSPKVTLKGDSQFTGLKYIEQGIEAEDISGDYSVSINIYNSNNKVITEINSPGNYRVEYLVKDDSENSTKITRNVNIVDVNQLVEETSPSSDFTITKTYYTIEGKLLDSIPSSGDYKIKYTVEDKYGNKTSFIKVYNQQYIEDTPHDNTTANKFNKGVIISTSIVSGILLIAIGTSIFIYKKKKCN